MRAVLDTNILISALFWRGAPHECLLSAEAGLYELILADEIFDELRDKLVDKFRNSDEEADQIIRNIQGCTELVQLQGLSGWVQDDPDDDKFIEAAIVSAADVVVSGDHHLLLLQSVEGIDILTAREFLHRLAGA